MDLNISIRLLP